MQRQPPIEYMARTRAWYAALGYPPYQWAHHDTTPFHRPTRALSETRIALVTTAAPFDPAHGDQGPHAPYNAAAKFYRVYECPVRPAPDLRISHLGYDRVHTHAADPNTWLPLAALEAAAADRRIGALAERLVGLPTDRSQRATLERDAPDVLAACRRMEVDAALLVPT
jgi:hypothetical protein